MSFTSVYQAPGLFDVALEDPPVEVREIVGKLGAAVVFHRVRLTDPLAFSVSDLFSMSMFTGILTGGSTDGTRMEGAGPAYLLTLAKQEEDQTVSKRPLYDGSKTSWVRNNVLRLGVSENNGITVGTITSASTPKRAGKIEAGQTPLSVLEDVCRRFSRFWRVNPNGTLDVGTRAGLWPSTSAPTVVASPKGLGRELNVTGLTGVQVSEVDDFDDYASEVVVNFTPDDYAFGVAYEVGDTVVATSGQVYECKLDHTSSGANLPPNTTYWDARDGYGTATASSVYVNPFTASGLVARRVDTARNATTYDDATDIATDRLARFDDPAKEITLSTDSFNVSGAVEAGDTIYVFSPAHGLVDTANEVPFGGGLLPAAAVRVTAVEENVSTGMGVVAVWWDGAAQRVTDLSPWVVWEPTGARLELGEPRRLRPRQLGNVSPGSRGTV